jgi:hypothetical protein
LPERTFHANSLTLQVCYREPGPDQGPGINPMTETSK